jgi:hypothetical protein
VGRKRPEEEEMFRNQAYALTVFFGWLITIFFVIIMLTAIALVASADQATPYGIFDFGCFGFFRDCNYNFCVAMPNNVSEGTMAIPPLSRWEYCTLDTETKLRSPACRFDSLLFHQSNTLMGYDVCEDKFSGGVYVFEDHFDYWQDAAVPSSTAEKSSKWLEVRNGFAGDFCGSVSGKNSLIFRGENARFAETIDLNLVSGGRVEFKLFLPPIGFDVSQPFCKTGYNHVLLQYSATQGGNWTTIATFDPSRYRQSNFFQVNTPLPDAAWTVSTRIRFIQPMFEIGFDNWALDDVRILRYLPTNWRHTSEYHANVRTAHSEIQRAQCCLDTDWCEKRFSARERIEKCSDFSWFQNERYMFRLSEIVLGVTAFINVIKFVYVAVYDYLVRRRYPFHDELVEIWTWPWFAALLKIIPVWYRPRPILPNEFTSKIHLSARLEEHLRNEFDDEEGQGAMLRSEKEIEAEKKQYDKKIRKQKKKLEKRMKNRNFKASTIVVGEDLDYERDLDRTKLPKKGDGEMKDAGYPALADSVIPNIPTDSTILASRGNDPQLLDDLEKMRRQELSMLRVPIGLEVDYLMIRCFAIVSILLFVGLLVGQLSVQENYVIYQPVNPFGLFAGKGETTASESPYKIEAPAIFIVFVAAYNDLKEIYHVLKEVIPARYAWEPLVTVDLSESVSAIIIQDHIVPISHISEIIAFPPSFIYSVLACVSVGVFPICLTSMLLREMVLSYSSMRYVTPLLGVWMIFRAIMGPLFLVKMGFIFEYLFDIKFKVREAMGTAFQETSSWTLAVNTAFGLACFSALVCFFFDVSWIGVVFGCFLGGGFIFGLCTGTIHQLPIKPWFCITSLRGGYWMRIKKERKCPCVYWCRYCTDIHESEEVLVLFTKDDFKFNSLINNGVQAVHGQK